MKLELSSEDRKVLQNILMISLEIQQSLKGDVRRDQLVQMIPLLQHFQGSNQLALQKVAEIQKHFSETMSVKHFCQLMLPIERILDRDLQDDDFLPTSEDRATTPVPRRPLYFILDNIRSAFNVGAVFRLADAVGASQIALCGYTPSPEQAGVKKTAMSADQFVKFQNFDSVNEALVYFRKLGVQLVALETSASAVSIYEYSFQGPTALVLGNERFGLDHSTLKQADKICQIPLFGIKNSLNVGQAAAVAAFEWSRKNP